MIKDHVTSKIESKIEVYRGLGNLEKSKIYYQSKFEYFLIHVLGYLWNKNINNLEINDKQYVINTVMRPSIGSIVSTARTLDRSNEIFGNKKLRKFYETIDKYPKLRNQRIGHGYLYEDATEEYVEVFEDLFANFETDHDTYFTESLVLIKVLSEKNGVFAGIKYLENGNQTFWSCPKEVYSFTENGIYSHCNLLGYSRISPFIKIVDDEVYVFSSIEERMVGRVKYNKLLKTGTYTEEIPEFEIFTSYSDSLKKRYLNDTIVTRFELNFKRYIDVGISKDIKKFLTKNKSSVYGTVWGHGGVGKTSAIQHVCELLGKSEGTRRFDYIIFTSAKDRFYNYYKGRIENIDTTISSLEDIITLSNKVIFDDDSYDIRKVMSYEGQVLFVIDDFETFSQEEKEKITNFIKGLDINRHKVIITTRSASLVTGEPIDANELDDNQTIEFLIQAIKIEYPNYDIGKVEKSLRKQKSKIWNATNGRPLFLFQLAVLIGQFNDLDRLVSNKISEKSDARKFLYDRIYDYLSSAAKDMFLATSLLVSKDDLSGVVSRLRFVLNMESDGGEDIFEAAFSELVKLKLIQRESDEIFKVYSNDVLKMMEHHYDNKDSSFNSDIPNRYNLISNSKAKDLDLAMLEVADSKRISSTEGEVSGAYRRIINRKQTSKEVRVSAFVNFSQYLVSFKQSIHKAVKLFRDYENKYDLKSEYQFVLLYSRYCWIAGDIANRNKSIKLLREFISKQPKLNENVYMEILCSLMNYTSLTIIGEREDLKNKYRSREISQKKYHNIYRYQKEKFIDIYKYPGNVLVNMIRDKNLMSYSGHMRDVILDSLVFYCEICTRSKKYKDAKNIILKVYSELPPDYHKPFQFKELMIDRIENPDLYNKRGNKKKDSELGIKLKKAFAKYV